VLQAIVPAEGIIADLADHDHADEQEVLVDARGVSFEIVERYPTPDMVAMLNPRPRPACRR
jgi:hypothetical protein